MLKRNDYLGRIYDGIVNLFLYFGGFLGRFLKYIPNSFIQYSSTKTFEKEEKSLEENQKDSALSEIVGNSIRKEKKRAIRIAEDTPAEDTAYCQLKKKFPTQCTKGNAIIEGYQTLSSILDIAIEQESRITYHISFFRRSSLDSEYFPLFLLSIRISPYYGYISETLKYKVENESDINNIAKNIGENTQNCFSIIEQALDNKQLNCLPSIPPRQNQSIQPSSALLVLGAYSGDSQPDSAIVVPEVEIEKYSSSVGYLKSNYGFLCTAFVVHSDGVIMTARHALNDLSPSSLNFYLLGKTFPITDIIELGDNFFSESIRYQKMFPDYALLKIGTMQSLPSLKLSTNSVESSTPGKYRIMGYADERQAISQLTPFFNNTHDNHEAIVLNYVAETEGGFSGAPFIDIQRGEVIGMHLKSSLQPITENQRTGLLFSHCVVDNSQLASLLRNNTYSNYAHNYIQNLLDEPLKPITTVIEGFLEREEASVRTNALGETPRFGSYTYRCLLARWLLKGDKKIRFKNRNDGIEIKYKNGIYIVSDNQWKIEINKQELKSQANEEGSVQEYFKDDKDVIKLINCFFSPLYWEVKLKIDAQGSTKWIPLTKKISSQSSQPAINMGHKLSAVEYWLKGSKDYCDERLKTKKLSPKYLNKNNEFKIKEQEYKARYEKYNMAGYLRYGLLVNENFMRDPKNYRFEWHSLNKSQGAKQGKTLQYENNLPPGIKVDNGRFVPRP